MNDFELIKLSHNHRQQYLMFAEENAEAIAFVQSVKLRLGGRVNEF